MKLKEKDRVQLNARVDKPLRAQAKFAAGINGRTIDGEAEVMIRFYFGEATEEEVEARERVLKAWKAVGRRVSFNIPSVAPFGLKFSLS